MPMAHLTPTEMPLMAMLLLAAVALGVVIGVWLHSAKEERRRKRWPIS